MRTICLFSHSVVFTSSQPHGLQHTRLLMFFTIFWSLLELMSIELVMPSNHLSFCHPLIMPSIFCSIWVFSNEFTSGSQSIGASASASVPSMNEYSGLFSFRVTGWISLQSKGLLRAFSSITVQNHQFLALSLLYSPALTSIRDYWKNHSFDNMDLCQQSNVSVFYYTGCFYISKYLWVQMCDFLSNLSVSFTSNFLLVLFKFCSSLIYFLSI